MCFFCLLTVLPSSIKVFTHNLNKKKRAEVEVHTLVLYCLCLNRYIENAKRFCKPLFCLISIKYFQIKIKTKIEIEIKIRTQNLFLFFIKLDLETIYVYSCCQIFQGLHLFRSLEHYLLDVFWPQLPIPIQPM